MPPDAIIASNGARFEHSNIASVKRREFSLAKTFGLGAGVAVVALYVLVASFFRFGWVG